MSALRSNRQAIPILSSQCLSLFEFGLFSPRGPNFVWTSIGFSKFLQIDAQVCHKKCIITNEQASYLKAQNVIKIHKSGFKTRNETMTLLSTNSKTGNRAGSNLSFLETHSIMCKIQSKQIVEHTIATMINRSVYIAK